MSAVVACVRDAFRGMFRKVRNVFRSIIDWLRLAYSPCPYWRGNMIAVQANGNPPFHGPLRMVISRVFQPSPWNVMEVTTMRPGGLPVRAVLKVFDRRFSPCVRDGRLAEACPPGEWSPAFEEEFQDFIRRGEAKEWVEYRQSEGFDASEKRNKLEEEVDRQLECEAAMNAELARLQGQSVETKGLRMPKVYATVSLSSLGENPSEALDVRGILLECTPGFSYDAVEAGGHDEESRVNRSTP
ncbi:hypothetical protein CSOJ01_03719 [Colletotrichum sojae]|uniref:Uncharacterized protein n=1 Tax=Colletotrichum sojae TaxID=2175907 RepID=A0A8H6JL11_9PEZI|nr:hypothetical protein CSOJ01_03719 [Colletotrichum sojae]